MFQADEILVRRDFGKPGCGDLMSGQTSDEGLDQYLWPALSDWIVLTFSEDHRGSVSSVNPMLKFHSPLRYADLPRHCLVLRVRIGAILELD